MSRNFQAVCLQVLFTGTLWVTALSSGCGSSGGPPPSPSSELTQTQESTHFTFHYSPGDSTDAARAEAFYVWASTQLSVSPSGKIQYYKFRDVAQKQRLTGRGGNAEADLNKYQINTIWPWDNHEVTHLLSAPLGMPPPLFEEGLAVSMQTDPLNNFYTPTWSGKTPDAWAKQYLLQGTLFQVTNVVEAGAFVSQDANTSYPSAGSFVGFLVSQYGLPRVLQFFSSAHQNDSAAVSITRFQQVFGKSLSEVEQDWHSYLQQYIG